LATLVSLREYNDGRIKDATDPVTWLNWCDPGTGAAGDAEGELQPAAAVREDRADRRGLQLQEPARHQFAPVAGRTSDDHGRIMPVHHVLQHRRQPVVFVGLRG